MEEQNKKTVDFFYHYTTQETLCSLLNMYCDDKAQGNLIFWASSIFTMNDPQEMKHGFDVFKVLIPFNEDFYGINPEERLNITTFDSTEILLDHSHTPFVISFCGLRDNLTMWSLYEDAGYGVVLKFNKNLVSYSPVFNGVKPENVYYGNGSDKIDVLFDIYNEGLLELRTCKNDEQRSKCRIKTLSKLYARICPFIKSDAYRNEKESRLSFYDVPSHLIKFRTRNKNIIPYVQISISVDYLEEIIIGPCCNFELAKSSIRYLLDCCGLQRVQISISSIPYRNL